MKTAEIKQFFKRQISTKHLSHAYIFSGNNESDKMSVVKYLLQTLLCSCEDEKPCGQCEWCHRVEENQLSDYFILETETKTIKVEQVRELREWLLRSPVEGTFKLALIKQAEKMTPSAANALLTILEEPKSEIYMVLDVIDSNLLLPTIRSRAQNIVFSQPEPTAFEELEIGNIYREILTQLPSKTALQIATMDKEDIEQWFELTGIFYQMIYFKNPQGFALVQARLKPILTSEKMLLSLDYLLWMNHQMMMRQMGSESVFSFNYLNELSSKQSVSLPQLLNINQQLLNAKQYLLSNVSAQLVAEKIILSL